MILSIDNVSKKYGDKLALNNFTAQLDEGVYGLIGPNGAGKTTLMNIVADVLKPTKGRVLMDGTDIHELKEKYRAVLGYLPQHPGMYKSFTARKFLKYMGVIKGIDDKTSDKRVDEVLEIVNLKEDADRKIGTFSGGMRQRLGIAQAILNDPKILILDEPTAGLDPKERIRFRNLISQISFKRIVILSTHIISDIEYIGREVMLIRKGNLIKKESSKDILKTIEGKVWKALITEEQFNNMEEKFNFSNVAKEGDRVALRIISDEKPIDEAEPVEPGLEDLYLYYFGEEAVIK